MDVDISTLRPGDELVLKDTSNDKDLKAWFRKHLPNGQILVYVERFKDVMKLQGSGTSGLGRFYIARKVM